MGAFLLLVMLLGAIAAMPHGMDALLGPALAQEGGQEGEAPPDAQTGSVSLQYSYSWDSTECGAGGCSRNAETEHFVGSAVLEVADGGFEGSGSGSYTSSKESSSEPNSICAAGYSSRLAYNGPASVVVHAQCSIDNPITGGPDTSQYDRSTTVVELLIEDHALHQETDNLDCEGKRESGSSDDGAVGFGCFFYDVDFEQAGTYVSHNQVTEDTSGTCTLQFIPPPPKASLRIFGTVKGLIDGKAPVPIANAKVVMANLDEGRLEKLSESKPPFRKKTTTTDDDKAEYEITFGRCGELPKVLVVSLLWYEDKPEFAVTNGPTPAPGKPRIPVYLAACVDDDPRSTCYKWKAVGDGYEAEVNFEYGNGGQLEKQSQFMDSEDWQGLGTKREILMDSAYIYYNSYRGVKYFDSLNLGYPRNPLIVQSHYKEELCAGGKDNAWYSDVAPPAPQSHPKFGDLGRHLDTVSAAGGGIFICSPTSVVNYPDAPVNREWHELGHYLQYQMYDPLKICPACEFHRGFPNDNTSMSFIEAFAEFTAALTNKYYGSSAPHLYPTGDTFVNLEIDYRTGSSARPLDPSEEEWAVAGILWDLYDPGKEIAMKRMVHGTLQDISRVYPNPVDQVALDEQLILQIIQKGKPKTVVDLYNVHAATWHVSKPDLDMIFLDHGFFADIVERNYIHDSAAETIPESGHAPDRMYRGRPPPALPGSYIVADADATFDVSITFLQGDGQYDYAYVLTMTRGAPAYFTMPPEYYPTKAVFSPVSADGKKLRAVFEISSEEYWTYIRSGPEKSAIFTHIPATGTARD